MASLALVWLVSFLLYFIVFPNRLIENIMKNALVELPSYFEVLSAIEQKRWFTQILHMERALGIIRSNEYLKEKLKKTKNDPDRTFVIHGLCNYDLIKNERYQHLFQYIPIEFRSPDEKFN